MATTPTSDADQPVESEQDPATASAAQPQQAITRPVPSASRFLSNRGLAITGIAVAGLLVLGGTFCGGVLVGSVFGGHARLPGQTSMIDRAPRFGQGWEQGNGRFGDRGPGQGKTNGGSPGTRTP